MNNGRAFDFLLRWFAGWLLALAALGASGPVVAQGAPDQLLFGPVQYNRTAGPPNQYSGSFAVPASAGAPFQLRIVNGAANGQNRISSGWVKLNGVQVVGPADFGQNVALIERNVNLSPGNTVDVRLASAPGGYIALSVLGTRILPVPTSLAPNPLTVTAGATGTLNATLSPAPAAAGVLSVASANTGVAMVLATVAFAPGQTLVPIPVTGVASGTTTVTASANGGAASATVNVNPAPPIITQLAPASVTLTQGSSGSLTVTISAAQSSDTSVALASSNSAIASVPFGVSVPAGELTAQIPVSAVSPGDAQITASLNGSSAVSQVTVTPLPPSVVSLLPAVSTVTLGAGTTLTLTISASQSSDTVVPLGVTPGGIVNVPAQVSIPAGQLSVAVPVATLAYGQAGVTATLNGSTASAAVNVVPPPISVTALEPATFTMTVGATSTFTVRINAAQTTNTDIALASSDPAVLQVPASVTIAQGATSATFTATGLAVGDATLTASANGTARTASVHVSPQPAAIVSLLPNPLPLQQGANGSLTVTINVAQEADTTILLANTDPAVAGVPEGVILVAGAISAQIPVAAIAAGSAQVTASVNGTSAVSVIDVTPPPPFVTTITPAALSLPKGTPGVLRVTVSRAPNAASAVALLSSDQAVASVPPQVNIPAGALFADFPVTSNSVGQATISATLNGGSASSIVTVAPAELVMLTLSPQTPTNYVGESVPFTATGTMTDGTTEDFTTRVSWSSSNTAVATIAATGVASVLEQGQTAIEASFSFIAVQTGLPATVSQNTVLTAKIPTPLVLAAPTTSLQVTQTVTVTITTSDAPPYGGLIVNLAGSGTGAGTFPANVLIPEYQTTATFDFTATAAGSFTLTAAAQNRLPGAITFSIQPQLAITGFTPSEGPVGTAVAISGTGFDPNLSANQVRFNGEPAVIVSGNASLLNAIAPPRATTGPITVTNPLGTAASSSPFTVQEREDFDLSVVPTPIQVPPGSFGNTRIRLSSTGLNPYPYAATLAISGLPAGVTATLDRPTVALNLDSIVTLNAAPGAAAGSFNITVSATGASGVTNKVVTKTFPVQVLAVGSTTVTGRVIHSDDDAPFIGARVRLGAGGPHVFTDETGTYRFINPPVLGDQVLLIDGGTNNNAQFEYPSGIAMPVKIIAGQDNNATTSYIGRVDVTKFTTIVPGQAATVTDPEIPGFALNIPQGATLIGWDKQPVTKINVRRVPVDRLPIQPLPSDVGMKSVFLYYFFREGGADPTTPIPVTYPNDLGLLPGEQAQLWYYDESPNPDPNSHQWRMMGLGTVSADGKSIVSNPGVGIPKFCCGAGGASPPFPPPPDPNGGGGGGDDPPTNPKPPSTCDPVDLASGNAKVFHPRLFGTMSVLMPVNLNCKYRSRDTRTGLFGRGMSFTYDWFAQQVADAVRVTNPDGVQFMLSRGADGVFRAGSGHQGALQMEVTPTASGRTLTLADGRRFEFDSPGRLTAIVDTAGNRMTFERNAQGFPMTMTDPAGKVYRFQISGTPPLVSRITDPAGRYVEFTYDASRRLRTYRDQGGGLTQLEYDSANRIHKMTDARGAIKEIEYDNADRAVRELLPEAAEHRFSYTAFGNTVAETRHTDPNGNLTTYRFSPLGYLTRSTDALGRVTRYELDSATSLLKRRVDTAGRATEFTYNSRGDVIRVVDANNGVTLIDYDLRFRKPVRIENPLGNVITMEYDNKGRLARLTNAENESIVMTYTARGQLESFTDPINRITRYTYDSSGNLVETTSPTNAEWRRTYDATNRLIGVLDPNHRATTFSYDDLDRLTEVQDASGRLVRYSYDANDNLLSAHDQNSNPVERNVYDLRNRIIQKTDAKNRSRFYVYDKVGNPIRTIDRKGQVTEFVYDALNRLIEMRDHDGRVTTYHYDIAGNLARVSDSQSGDLLMTYDALDRLLEVVSPAGSVKYTYDAFGRRLSRTVSGGDATTYTYDKANRLRSVTLRGKTASYSYDASGRLVEKVLPDGIGIAYVYDDDDRVTSMTYTKPDGVVIETLTYGYDVSGQRLSKAQGSASLSETPFSATYDEANRLTTITIDGEPFTLSYDDNGNLISRSGPITGTTTYVWNARNQLIQIAGPSVSAAFAYDAGGRRIQKSVNGQTTGFLYDGQQAIAELRGGSIDVSYHTGLGLDEVLARYSASGNRTLLTDALMSVIAQSDEGQAADAFYSYSPYGETLAMGDDRGNALQYTGRENDQTGLYYYRARYYDPVLKRFISEDPAGIRAGMNIYAYVHADPISFTDPTGLELKGKSKVPNLVKELICYVVEGANDLNNWEQQAMINEEMQLWNRNLNWISETHRGDIERCIALYSNDKCKLQECIDEASKRRAEAVAREDERHNKAMEQLLKPSPGQKAGGVLNEICQAATIM
jgi:RHS repeat-associated protein